MLKRRVVVFTRKGCVQCKFTEKLLTEQSVPHLMVDIDEHAWAMGAVDRAVERSGQRQLPLVMTPTERWHGFRPEKIRGLGHSKP